MSNSSFKDHAHWLTHNFLWQRKMETIVVINLSASEWNLEGIKVKIKQLTLSQEIIFWVCFEKKMCELMDLMEVKSYWSTCSVPVRSSQDVWEEATRKLLRNVSGPAAFDQNVPFSSILLFGSGTTPAERKCLNIIKLAGLFCLREQGIFTFI